MVQELVYVNPDQTTYDFINGREYAPKGTAFDNAVTFWNSIKSDSDAEYDDIYTIDATTLAPMVTWGITPGQAIGVDSTIPTLEGSAQDDKDLIEKALTHMHFSEGESFSKQKN